MYFPLVDVCGAVIRCTSVDHHPFAQLTKQYRGWISGRSLVIISMLKALFITFCALILWPLSLFVSHQKAYPHSTALLGLSAVLIYSIPVTKLWQTMPIIHIKQIRDLHGERRNVAHSKSCECLLTCLFSIMLRTDRIGLASA